MARLAEHLVQLARSVVADPEARVSELALATEAERRRVLVEWNDTDAPYQDGRCLHELFEAQAARTPDAVAVRFEDRACTYAELDNRSNRLARHLVQLGAGPDVRVGVCLERSLDLPVALLAILKAGGAYVPLEPGYPDERLAFMVGDAACAVLVTRTEFEGRLSGAGRTGSDEPVRPAVVRLDADRARIEALDGRPLSDADRRAPLTPDHLAYVIYTSGSTGAPKGAMNAHAGLRQSAGAGCSGAIGLDADRLRRAEDAVQLRRLGLGVLLAAHDRRARCALARPGRAQGHRYLLERVSRGAASRRCTSCPRCCEAFLLERAGRATLCGRSRA